LSGLVLSSSPSSPASLSPKSTSLSHDHVPSSDEVPLLSILSSGIYQVDALLATPKAKEFVQTLVAMDTCCELDLIREDMVPKDAIKQYVAEAPRVRDANGRLVNLSAAVSLKCQSLIKSSKAHCSSPLNSLCRLFCRPDQFSLTNSYVDDNSGLISELLASLFLHDDFASRHLHIQLLRNDYTVPTRCRYRGVGGIVDPLGSKACRAIRQPISPSTQIQDHSIQNRPKPVSFLSSGVSSESSLTPLNPTTTHTQSPHLAFIASLARFVIIDFSARNYTGTFCAWHRQRSHL
jgi:hypothetical protein